ncbi:MAG: hypothetical protein HYW63_00975 [Candidatus Levybacteria bacterium]|nr:hypothetical protein [Candidatus Levybacteria bacterium]
MRFNPRILIIVIIAISLIFIGIFYLFNSKQSNQSQTSSTTQNSSEITSEKFDYKASFAIYTNGTFRIFEDPKYHNLSEDVYIGSSNPNIVNIKKANITWDNFFKTLPMSLRKDCLTTGTIQTFCTNGEFVLQFYINGTRNQSALDQVINLGDKLLVTFERENSPVIQSQISSIPDSN